MENGEVKQTVLIKKGFFYYIFQIIFFPFRILFYIFKKIFEGLKHLLLEFSEITKERKRFNKFKSMVRIKPPDEEVV